MHLSSVPYTFDKSYMGLDIENMIMLTNHHIKQYSLCNDDDDHYNRWLGLVYSKSENLKRKHSESNRRWKRKFSLLSCMGSVLEDDYIEHDQSTEQEAQYWNI